MLLPESKFSIAHANVHTRMIEPRPPRLRCRTLWLPTSENPSRHKTAFLQEGVDVKVRSAGSQCDHVFSCERKATQRLSSGGAGGGNNARRTKPVKKRAIPRSPARIVRRCVDYSACWFGAWYRFCKRLSQTLNFVPEDDRIGFQKIRYRSYPKPGTHVQLRTHRQLRVHQDRGDWSIGVAHRRPCRKSPRKVRSGKSNCLTLAVAGPRGTKTNVCCAFEASMLPKLLAERQDSLLRGSHDARFLERLALMATAARR